ncbi:MAG: potassium transporter Kup [Ilumatobacteraceae bacterium]
MTANETQTAGRGGIAALGFGALGIVYGDIGTSPIYAIRESFDHADLTVDVDNAYGVASVVFWALLIVISIKYLALVMRADNHGEGGILALTALVAPRSGNPKGALAAVISLGVFGTALLYGDGLITPAISVLSAVEGFEVASDAFERFVIPISIVILVGLFAVQRRGTAQISRVFGPVMLIWFVTLGVLGLRQVLQHPAVLRAVSPTVATEFFVDEPLRAFIALGSIFLVVTGGEALYADMGHFGRRPIQFSWYVLVLPALVLNYFGQAALLGADPAAIESPFYRLAPSWAILPLAVLATCATVIASQALISGAFSLTAQAVQLDYLPRMRIVHTSSDHVGQIYVPVVNWLLMVGCVGLVLGFRTSSNLASAYGIAVTMTMLITTLLFYRVARVRWGWSTARGLAVCIPLLIVDTAFFSANLPKIVSGGWFPLVVGLVLVTLMTTWRRGRQLVAERIHRGERPIESVVHAAVADDVARVPGVAVYMFKDAGCAPPAMIANLEHNHVLHRLTLLVAVETADVPRVPVEERLTQRKVGPGIQQVDLVFGFLDSPNVPDALRSLDLGGQDFDPDQATYFIGREAVMSTKAPGMHPIREHLFVGLNRSASSASRFFSLPRSRVFEVGTVVEI